MANKHDWEKWRRLYVVGEDDVTLPSIALIPGAPSLPSLKRVCAAELWADQRKRYREQRDTLAIRDEATVSAVRQVEKIVDAAEMLTRHAQISKSFQALAATWLQTLKIPNTNKFDMEKVAKLKPGDIFPYLKWAVDTERMVEGLATQRQEVDVSGLSNAELENIAKGA